MKLTIQIIASVTLIMAIILTFRFIINERYERMSEASLPAARYWLRPGEAVTVFRYDGHEYLKTHYGITHSASCPATH